MKKVAGTETEHGAYPYVTPADNCIQTLPCQPAKQRTMTRPARWANNRAPSTYDTVSRSPLTLVSLRLAGLLYRVWGLVWGPGREPSFFHCETLGNSTKLKRYGKPGLHHSVSQSLRNCTVFACTNNWNSKGLKARVLN